MDQEKIGKFISKVRKEKNITQEQLADKLHITNRAISKWENGICLPDVSIMMELCKILDISINDLFIGEKTKNNENSKKLEENILNLLKKEELQNKKLMRYELVIGLLSSITFIILIFIFNPF